MRFLEVGLADLRTGNVARQRHHGRSGAVGVIEAIDEVQVAWAATASAGHELAGQVRLGAGGEGCCFLMANVNPVHAPFCSRPSLADRINDGVQAVTDNAIHPADACRNQLRDDLVCDSSCHAINSITPTKIA